MASRSKPLVHQRLADLVIEPPARLLTYFC
jgi:hypothetical protein